MVSNPRDIKRPKISVVIAIEMSRQRQQLDERQRHNASIVVIPDPLHECGDEKSAQKCSVGREVCEHPSPQECVREINDVALASIMFDGDEPKQLMSLKNPVCVSE